MAARSNSPLLAVALILGVALLCAAPAFVPSPQTAPLRGLKEDLGVVTAAAATAGAPFAAHAVPDEYIPYRMYGEWTVDFAVQYFALTTAGTLFAFGCYFILTKLKII